MTGATRIPIASFACLHRGAAIAQQLPGGKRRAACGLGAEAGKAWLSRPWVLTISLLDRGRNRCRCRAFLCQQKPNAMGDKRS